MYQQVHISIQSNGFTVMQHTTVNQKTLTLHKALFVQFLTYDTCKISKYLTEYLFLSNIFQK